MKFFRYSLSFGLLLLTAVSGYSQVAGTLQQPALGASASAWLPIGSPVEPVAIPMSDPSAQSVDLSHFDNTKPVIQLALPVTISPYTMIALGERFTLPQASGYVDSVTFVVDTALGDSITVGLAPDSLYEVSPGSFYHLISIWSTADFGEVNAPIMSGQSRTVITVHFPHVAVPQNFWVYVAPNLGGSGFTSTFTVEGDREPVVPRTADNTYSGFIASVNGQAYSAVLDSTFFDANGDMIYSNLNITAHVSLDANGVSKRDAAPSIAVFPNPTADVLNISGVSPDAKSEIVDALGRVVASVDGPRASVRYLTPGAYSVITHSGGGVSSQRFVVSR